MFRYIIITAIFFVTLIITARAQQFTREDYIVRYHKLAIAEMKRTGIPASITLAQGLLESNNGNSKLARKANNHFGIKCHSSWDGPTMHKNDDKRNECFRKYKSDYESFKDHSEFLTQGKRYSFLFELSSDNYKGWAHGLKKAGYATNPKYPALLIKIIEDNQLYRYDTDKSLIAQTPKITAKDKSKDKQKNTKKVHSQKQLANIDEHTISAFGRKVLENNRVPYIVAKESDTYYKIAREMDLMLWQLFKYNDLPKNAGIAKGQQIYLKPKRNKAERGYEQHMVKPGETMYTISQKYGLKLNKLYKKNRLEPGTKIRPGDVLNLRKNKKPPR